MKAMQWETCGSGSRGLLECDFFSFQFLMGTGINVICVLGGVDSIVYDGRAATMRRAGGIRRADSSGESGRLSKTY